LPYAMAIQIKSRSRLLCSHANAPPLDKVNLSPWTAAHFADS
jgi:hypothetical protein